MYNSIYKNFYNYSSLHCRVIIILKKKKKTKQKLTTTISLPGPIRADHDAPVPAAVHRVRLPSHLHDLDRSSRSALPGPLLRLLQSQVQHTDGQVPQARRQGERQHEQQQQHGRVYARPRGRVLVVVRLERPTQAERRQLVRDDLQQGVQQLLQQRHEQRLRGEHGRRRQEACLIDGAEAEAPAAPSPAPAAALHHCRGRRCHLLLSPGLCVSM